MIKTLAVVKMLPASILRHLHFKEKALDSTTVTLFNNGSEGTPLMFQSLCLVVVGAEKLR
ncbi:MAG: hypothetical protein JRI86_05200 [Deltaproteobacteria bacterium]|nr:hypothetical protein [Deltaproteobacteria bacterium]